MCILCENKSHKNWVNWIILVTRGKINQPRFYEVVVSENRLVKNIFNMRINPLNKEHIIKTKNQKYNKYLKIIIIIKI